MVVNHDEGQTALRQPHISGVRMGLTLEPGTARLSSIFLAREGQIHDRRGDVGDLMMPATEGTMGHLPAGNLLASAARGL